MTEFHHLLGADDVRAGGHAVREGGEAMRAAASSLDFTLFQHRQHMDDWLLRFEALIERMEKAAALAAAAREAGGG